MKSIDDMTTWKQLKKELLTEVEIEQLDARVELTRQIINARKERGISQKKLEELSGVSQPVIARFEKGKTIPKIETIIKLLAPLGKTLKVVDSK